jgi:hypothetical protein
MVCFRKRKLNTVAKTGKSKEIKRVWRGWVWRNKRIRRNRIHSS